jgi:hypothetical protein
MPSAIVIRCPSCASRIQAPVRLLGEERACPGCGRAFTVRPPTPADAAPSLLDCRVRLAAGGFWPTRRRVGR